eukprot:2256461-Pleurochrysis_carterae.AAC.1
MEKERESAIGKDTVSDCENACRCPAVAVSARVMEVDDGRDRPCACEQESEALLPVRRHVHTCVSEWIHAFARLRFVAPLACFSYGGLKHMPVQAPMCASAGRDVVRTNA